MKYFKHKCPYLRRDSCFPANYFKVTSRKNLTSVYFPGWTGLTCESDINECNLTWYNDSSPCERGVCINLDGTYECDCSGTGYTGDRCELEIDECELEPPVCKNGGSCINTNGSYSCNCSIGYEGTNCTNPNCTGVCLYDGNCSVTENETWACQCPSFHEGDLLLYVLNVVIQYWILHHGRI